MGNFYMVGSCWRAICGFDIENICFAFVDEKSGQLQVWFGLDIENMKQMFTGWWFGLDIVNIFEIMKKNVCRLAVWFGLDIVNIFENMKKVFAGWWS